MVILGDVRVGKTTLLRRCLEDKRANEANEVKITPTIAVEFGAATLLDTRIKFWDVCTFVLIQLVKASLTIWQRVTLGSLLLLSWCSISPTTAPIILQSNASLVH